MLILGIDPGLQRTGFGVIRADGPRLAYVASGTISTLEAPRGDLPLRLKIIFEGVQEVVQRYQPDCACVEIVFVNVNPQSTLLLGQARGAAVAALVTADLPVTEYTALQMKKAVVGPWPCQQRASARDGAAFAEAAHRAGQRRRRCAGPGDFTRACGRVVCGPGQRVAFGAASTCAIQKGPHVLRKKRPRCEPGPRVSK
jgi:crossover junction endodeoxyribonuclease RuvC